jgi:hypothetical protein
VTVIDHGLMMALPPHTYAVMVHKLYKERVIDYLLERDGG